MIIKYYTGRVCAAAVVLYIIYIGIPTRRRVLIMAVGRTLKFKPVIYTNAGPRWRAREKGGFVG